ncbi:MAG: CHAT domain-containing protein [Acidobacteriota bacterium]|nr:CHAT domain-containing protein [Acidobacteriota bacterium]
MLRFCDFCKKKAERPISSRAVIYQTTPAGARTLLTTLRPVDDIATQAFMDHFYTHYLAGSSPRQALRRVQIEFQEHETYHHPFYWAPFHLIEITDAANSLRSGGEPMRSGGQPIRFDNRIKCGHLNVGFAQVSTVYRNRCLLIDA